MISPLNFRIGGAGTPPDTSVEVNNVPKGSVSAGSTLDVNLTDGTNPVTPTSSNLSGTTLTVTLPPAVTIPVGATLMKTGVTISTRTGDDGDIEAGRATSFLILPSNNPFGNTNRFTDTLGGTSYANNWVIDWSTYNGSNVLGYFRTPQPAAQWNNAVTNSLGTFGTFSGCRLTNIRELMNIAHFENGNGNYLYLLQYTPFNIIDDLWSSTTLNTQVNYAWLVRSGNPLITYEGKGGVYKYIPCRTFTVTGTTLT